MKPPPSRRKNDGKAIYGSNSRSAGATSSFRDILVPLDGSPVAEQILPSVVSVAQAMSGEVILFQVPTTHTNGWLAGE